MRNFVHSTLPFSYSYMISLEKQSVSRTIACSLKFLWLCRLSLNILHSISYLEILNHTFALRVWLQGPFPFKATNKVLSPVTIKYKTKFSITKNLLFCDCLLLSCIYFDFVIHLRVTSTGILHIKILYNSFSSNVCEFNCCDGCQTANATHCGGFF